MCRQKVNGFTPENYSNKTIVFDERNLKLNAKVRAKVRT